MSDRTIFDYVEAMATPNPAPGAGSAAASTAAMGCALGEMVCNITSKSAPGDGVDLLEGANRTLHALRSRLLELAPADEAAYMGFREAQALPKSTPEEKSARKTAMQATLLVAADVPLEIAESSSKALAALVDVSEHGSRYTLADIATAAHLLNSAMLGAAENVAVNIGLIQDPVQRKRLTNALLALEQVRSDAHARIFAMITRRT